MTDTLALNPNRRHPPRRRYRARGRPDPAVLPFAPPGPALECVGLWVIRHEDRDHRSSVIVRVWSAEPYGVCDRCPRELCRPRGRTCVVQAGRHVELEDAAGFVLPPED